MLNLKFRSSWLNLSLVAGYCNKFRVKSSIQSKKHLQTRFFGLILLESRSLKLYKKSKSEKVYYFSSEKTSIRQFYRTEFRQELSEHYPTQKRSNTVYQVLAIQIFAYLLESSSFER